MFRKSHICKFADLIFLDFRLPPPPPFRKRGNLGYADHIFFAVCGYAICGLTTSANPQMHNFYTYKYKLKKCSDSNLRTTFDFWDMAFRSL
jgi:hypothetical protein